MTLTVDQGTAHFRGEVVTPSSNNVRIVGVPPAGDSRAMVQMTTLPAAWTTDDPHDLLDVATLTAAAARWQTQQNARETP